MKTYTFLILAAALMASCSGSVEPQEGEDQIEVFGEKLNVPRSSGAWDGKYHFSEPPVEENIMEWDLTVKGGRAVVEINGQQTSEKIHALVHEVETDAIFTFDSIEVGMSSDLTQGDTLFILERKDQKITTIWKRMTPEVPAGEGFKMK